MIDLVVIFHLGKNTAPTSKVTELGVHTHHSRFCVAVEIEDIAKTMFSVPMLLVLTMSACSVVSAFVVPLQSRPSFLLNAFSRDPVTQAGEGKRSDGRHMQMRYIAMNRWVDALLHSAYCTVLC